VTSQLNCTISGYSCGTACDDLWIQFSSHHCLGTVPSSTLFSVDRRVFYTSPGRPLFAFHSRHTDRSRVSALILVLGGIESNTGLRNQRKSAWATFGFNQRPIWCQKIISYTGYNSLSSSQSSRTSWDMVSTWRPADHFSRSCSSWLFNPSWVSYGRKMRWNFSYISVTSRAP